MLGAIIGDIIGSVYERSNVKEYNFEIFHPKSHFTDDTVLTIATADAILNDLNFQEFYTRYANKYPKAGYGRDFFCWSKRKKPKPYNSFGNGSAMRISPVGFIAKNIDEALYLAKKSAEVTHNHPEGIKGAQAIASAIFMAKIGKSKQNIKSFIEFKFGYDLNRSCGEIRKVYSFNATCQGSVPESIIAFLESNTFEDAIRLAISLGGDADTMAAITGSIAEAYYQKIPFVFVKKAFYKLDYEMIDVIKSFYKKYKINNTYTIKLEDNVPKKYLANTIYLIGKDYHFWLLTMLCPCGCNDTINLNLLEEHKPSWNIQINKNNLFVTPSIWKTTGCKSHFFIKHNKIIWV